MIRSARPGLPDRGGVFEADVDAPHVQLADQAVLIGPAGQDSYLDPSAILDAAARTGAGAIHPLWLPVGECGVRRGLRAGGFISSAAAIEAMGNKAESKCRMLEARCPVFPATGPDQSDKALLSWRRYWRAHHEGGSGRWRPRYAPGGGPQAMPEAASAPARRRTRSAPAS